MLTSRGRYLWWAKRDRVTFPPPPLFRLLARNWQPQLPAHLRTPSASRWGSRLVAMPKKEKAPVWNPWLWVK